MPGEGLVERLAMKLEAHVFGELTETPRARARVPQGPGLGRDPDLAIVERYKVL